MIRNTPTILRISGEKKIKSWKLTIIITVEPLVVLALRHALKDDQRHKVRSDCQNVHDVHRVFQKVTLLSCSSKPEKALETLELILRHLRMYSRVNQVMQMVSIMEIASLSVGLPVSSGGPCRAGRVPITIATVDTTTKRTDTHEMTWQGQTDCLNCQKRELRFFVFYLRSKT